MACDPFLSFSPRPLLLKDFYIKTEKIKLVVSEIYVKRGGTRTGFQTPRSPHGQNQKTGIDRRRGAASPPHGGSSGLPPRPSPSESFLPEAYVSPPASPRVRSR
uniref:Uncharacterized protein n=1 Tax=Oryza brachyantha TaxID=4533 RepID=J3L2B8_ORYBR